MNQRGLFTGSPGLFRGYLSLERNVVSTIAAVSFRRASARRNLNPCRKDSSLRKISRFARNDRGASPFAVTRAAAARSPAKGYLFASAPLTQSARKAPGNTIRRCLARGSSLGRQTEAVGPARDTAIWHGSPLGLQRRGRLIARCAQHILPGNASHHHRMQNVERSKQSCPLGLADNPGL